MSLRSMLPDITPVYLQGPIGSAYMYTLTTPMDVMEAAFVFALYARCPQFAPIDAFSWIGQDRGVDRGFFETDDQYATRLLLWVDLWKLAGSDRAILIAVLSLFVPSLIRVRMVSDSSVWNSLGPGSDPVTIPIPTYHAHPTSNWRWDSNAGPIGPFRSGISWWRSWVLVYVSGIFTKGKNIGDGHHLGDGTALGFSGTSLQGKTIKQIVAKWKAAHAWVVNVILVFDDTLFEPTADFGDIRLPDGQWGHWGKIVSKGGYAQVYAPSRSPNASYLGPVQLPETP